MEKLAILGGTPAISNMPDDLFRWPIVTREDEEAVLEVLRNSWQSGTQITEQFEKEFAAWQGMRHAVAYCNGTLALEAAMFACGLGSGDEMICASKTYWASCLQIYNLGATVVFADIEPDSLCIDPKDIERCIGPRTKAIMVVHYLSHPAKMDEIMAIAKKHNLLVIEDVSHAQGGLYKGQKLGTFGHVSAMSLMIGKSFATGEMGVLVTNDKEKYDRALAYSHYERNNAKYISTENLQKYANMPLGGMKGRVNQMCSAMGRVQLKYYDERCAEIRKAMNYFWDLLADVPGIQAHRVNEAEGSNMAGWYAAHGIYKRDELGGLPLSVFNEAIKAEGYNQSIGGNLPLHTHPVFQDYNGYNTEKPTRIAFTDRDVRLLDHDLPVTEALEMYSVPWFKHYKPEYIEQYAAAFRKVALQADQLMARARPDESKPGHWFFFKDE
ncbi:MAG: DegT/DnrJ/EryC1/StrS family aminotransferase [Ruminococcaceae bacterium]|nr:DegT/DnrJ/EryC1/StrS family aminotransferase [Oscillospiraceae bacterium]